ncbi:MAG: hypothetical protein Q9157_000007 [Trypethelium eluteriae]
MSFARTVTSSAALAFKAACFAGPTQTAPLRCPQCLRRFPSSRLSTTSSGRWLQTATTHRPPALEPPPPPPRNTGIPDTSIARGAAEIDIASRPGLENFRQSNPTPHQDQSSGIKKSEAEAQIPKPTTSTSSSSIPTGPSESSSSPTKSKRPKLRPRKAAMNLTPTAVTQLQDLLNQPEPKFIRVGVKNRGCSGLAYHLEYVEKPGKFDEIVEQDGVKVLIDSKALFSIIGSEMDWIEDKLNRRFIFKNPNISKSRPSVTTVFGSSWTFSKEAYFD